MATFAAAAVSHPAAINQKLLLGGPEPLSWCGIVHTYGQVLGQELPVRFVATAEPILGLPEMIPPMLAAMETYDSSIPMDGIARLFGVKQITLTSFIHRTLNLPGA